MLDLNQALAFVMVVRHGSFAGAARALEIPRSTVSARIGALETHLGVRLLRRTTRKVALTDAGRAYHATVAEAVETLLAADAGGGERRFSGSIRLTAPAEYPHEILSRAILAFHARHPRVRFDVLLTNRVVDFVADNVDLAIRGGDPGSAGRVASKLGDVPFGLFASPRYLQARGRPERHADLGSHDVLPFIGKDGRRVLGLPLVKALKERSALVSSDSMTLLKRLALDGAGIAILPVHLCAAEMQGGALVHLLPEWWGAEIAPAYLVYPSRRDISPRVRAFAQCLKEVVTSMATTPA
ncbi:LysR family transcriptional regulator [Pendulispora rubella]|uniref:LysR family transcriptional regulator n=1 Tax=Pendulispora rubella TaxID=2741070 RepID=A0ABZ2L1P5_9BACT